MNGEPVIASGARALVFQTLALLAQAIALTAFATLGLLFFGMRTGGEPGVARDKTVEFLQELGAIALVGFYLLAVLVPVARTHHVIGDAHCFEPPVQPVTKAAGFIAAIDFLCQARLLLRPGEDLFGSKALRRLRRTFVDLTGDHILVRVDVEAELDHFGLLANVRFGWHGSIHEFHRSSGLGAQRLLTALPCHLPPIGKLMN